MEQLTRTLKTKFTHRQNKQEISIFMVLKID